ncbi:MAG: M3 family metallopeptidase [Patescibacteria group bacterium]|nr:M3 family metallopeptidase [Patescibacteria group bacterium]
MSEQTLPIWDLSDLYAGAEDVAVQNDLRDMQDMRNQLIALKDDLAASPLRVDAWELALDYYDRHAMLSQKLADFARLKADEDVTNQSVAAFLQKVQNDLSQAEAEMTFFPLFVSELKDDEAEMLAKDDETCKFTEFIRQSRRLKPHLLPEDQERLLILTMQREREAWARFENQLAPRLPFGEIELDGKLTKLTPSLITALLEHSDANVRSTVYNRRCEAYQKEQSNLAFAYSEQVRNVVTEKDLRKYKDIASFIADRDDLPENFVPQLLGAARDNQNIFTKFFAWKAKQIGLEKLPAADLVAPLAQDAEASIEWSEAKELTHNAFNRLDAEFASHADKFFEHNWIHAQPSAHKSTGAYCMYAPQHPFILLSYQNKLNDVNTLAHEVGHGVHALLFAEQKILQRHPGLILAETASQFGELMLLEELKSKSPQTYNYALRHFLEHGMNAIYQQLLITQFESNAFDQAQAQGLTADWLSGEWLKLKQELGQNSVDYPDMEKWTWARISHIFFHPFYCYSYAASLLLVLALAKKFSDDPQAFAGKFKSLLSAGGSMKADDLLRKTMGFGLDDGAYLEMGFEQLETMVDEATK